MRSNRLKTWVFSQDLTQKALRSLWHFRSHYFDWRHGVETAAKTSFNHLKIDSSNAQYGGGLYEAVGIKAARNALRLDIDHRKYAFVDFGSGKGRVLLLASEYPYRRIIGVEFAEELHQAALRNIRKYRSRHRRCSAIESIHADAAEFQIPATPLVLHFFNPFGPPVMSRVLANIQASLEKLPRDAIFIYHTPRHVQLFERLPNVRLLTDGPWLKVYRMPGPTEAG
ncbi:MAG: class I SAM-dependent methyltransferase [Terriglobia bacterium]